MKANGYKPADSREGGRDTNPKSHYLHGLEVLVHIDRDGNFLLSNGRHRYAIARVLDLEILVQVVCRHKEWQTLRDELTGVSETDAFDETIATHPDLQKLCT